MTTAWTRIAAVLVLGLGAWAAFVLVRPAAPPSWLRLLGADSALPGTSWPATVTVTPVAGESFVALDLHGGDRDGRWLGCIGSVPPQPLAGGASTHTFLVPLRDDPALREIWAVVVLSAQGDWPSRTRVALSEPLPLRQPVATRPLQLRVAAAEPAQDPPADAARAVAAAVWLLAAASWWRRRSSGPALALACACAVAALVEGSGALQAAAAASRELALRLGLYQARHEPQQIATVLAILLPAALCAALLSRPDRNRLSWALVCAFTALAASEAVSLHEADRLLRVGLPGLPLALLLRTMAGTVTGLAALWPPVQSSQPPPSTRSPS